MAEDVKPGFSMEVSGQSVKGVSAKRSKKVKEEVSVALVVIAVLIIAGFGLYWYFQKSEEAPLNSGAEVTAPEVVSSDIESDVYADVPSAESVVPEAASVVPNPLEDVYANPFE